MKRRNRKEFRRTSLAIILLALASMLMFSMSSCSKERIEPIVQDEQYVLMTGNVVNGSDFLISYTTNPGSLATGFVTTYDEVSTKDMWIRIYFEDTRGGVFVQRLFIPAGTVPFEDRIDWEQQLTPGSNVIVIKMFEDH